MIELISWIVAFVVAITFHEAAHAWAADKLGDPTARALGRLSLNPIVHYDKYGTTLLLILTIVRALGVPVIPFGWAKPVPFDPYNLKNPRKDAMLISLAGPLTNILIACTLALLGRFLLPQPEALTLAVYNPSLLGTLTSVGQISYISFILGTLFGVTIILNLVLAVFNLIPVHPLDGGKILVGLLPKSEAREADMFLKKYGFMILFLLIIPINGSSAVSRIMDPFLNFTLGILIPSISAI